MHFGVAAAESPTRWFETARRTLAVDPARYDSAGSSTGSLRSSPRPGGAGRIAEMAARRDDFELVRKLGLELPEVEEGTMYGAPALKIRGKLLACMASHKSAEPGSLVVRIDFDDRDALIADDPAVYYVKPHYLEYPSVLVRLALIEPEALRDLLRSAWRTVTASAPARPRSAAIRDRSKTRRSPRTRVPSDGSKRR